MIKKIVSSVPCDREGLKKNSHVDYGNSAGKLTRHDYDLDQAAWTALIHPQADTPCSPQTA